jgi:replicative DNA helicase
LTPAEGSNRLELLEAALSGSVGDEPEPYPPKAQRLLAEVDEVLAEDGIPTGMAGRLFDGLAFGEEVSKAGPAVWGEGERVLWAPGEPLMIYGPQGAGKSTLAQRLLLARAGVVPSLLGLPVQPAVAPIVYVAADRPLQLARSWQRMIHYLSPDKRRLVRDLVRFWKGPLGFDIGSDPEALLRFMVEIGATTLIGDSLKDLAVDLIKDEAGTRVNRAWQLLVAAGIEVADLHHPRKAVAGESRKPKSLDDVYGSTWLSAGHGSVLLLWGNPGDPIVELSHLKQPQEEVGPLRVLIDHELGEVEVHDGGDPLAILRAASSPMAAKDVARVLFSSDRPTDAEIEKARRRCDRLVGLGLAAADRQGRDDHGRPHPVLYTATAKVP